MATFHENLKQSFKNFKNKYIGNVPSGVTLAQINADLTDIPKTKVRVTYTGASNTNGYSNNLTQIINDNKPSGLQFAYFTIVGFINRTTWNVPIFNDNFDDVSFNSYSNESCNVNFTIDLFYK
jgi:hypothetical protein